MFVIANTVICPLERSPERDHPAAPEGSATSVDAIITLVVLTGLLGLLITGRISPSGGIMGAAVVLLLTGVITPEEAFAGFSNEAVATIAALYVVAHVVQRSGLLDAAVARVLITDERQRRTLTRLLLPIAAASAFLNNTPIVAATAPVVYSRAATRGRSASRYLMPLSYATILGGVVTTIGTSTNLVVSGLLVERGLPAFGLFTMTPIGLPLAIVGVGLLIVSAPLLLPDRPTPGSTLVPLPRQYSASFTVRSGGPLDGAKVTAAGLRHLPGGFLAAVEREGRVRVASADERLYGRDIVTFVGEGRQLAALLDHPGLKAVEQRHVPDFAPGTGQLVEAVVGAESPLVGRGLADIGFRSRYAAAVLSVHRDGRPAGGKLGTVPLRAGDALLIFSDPDFAARWEGRDDFALLAPLCATAARADVRRARITGVVVGAMIAAAAIGLLPILHAALAAVLLLVLTRTVTVPEARDAIDLDVLLVVAGAFALGAAMEASGLAEQIAALVSTAAQVGGRPGGVVAIVAGTMLLTEPLSNAAAAALMLPVALTVATQLGGDPVVFATAVAIAASASFLTPIGYQTNTMVYGLGGYRFSDYTRLGIPLTAAALAIISTGVLLLAW